MKEFLFKNEIYLIFIGKNAQNNWELFDNSFPKYILFHVYPGFSSYIILKNNNYSKLRDIPLQIIKRCSCLCKSHSNSKNLNNVEIHYTFVENCKKGEKVGQVIMDKFKIVNI